MGDHQPGRGRPPGLSPSLTTSPVADSSAISTPDNAVSELRGESRGRKKNENLPPSRAREVQRAFRARRAAHLAKLEDRIVELEAENTELRRLLLLPLPDRGILGSGPTGRGKSLKEGGVPMSERVKAKRERDRKRAEEAARARGVTLPREASPDDDTRSKGARAASATATSGKKRKYSANGEELEDDEDHRMDGRHVSESYSVTPSSSSMGMRSPSIALPTPLAASSGLPNKQSTRLPSFSSNVTDLGGRASSYTPHLGPPPLDPISTAFLSGTQTPISPMHSGSLDTSSAGLISAALGGFPNELHQPFAHQQQQNPFGNLGAGMPNQPQDSNAALLNSLLAALPGGGMSQNNGNQFGSQNGNANLPPLPELLSIILKNPELQRRVLQHQMAQKAQQNQMSQRQQPQPFSASTAFPSSLFGFDSFDKANSAQDLPGFGGSPNDGLNLSRMDPSTLFNDLFNNGRNLQGNGSNGNGNGNNQSTFIPSLMDTINLTEPQFPTGNERPSSAGGNSNSNYDRLFGNPNRGMSNQNPHPERDFLATSPDDSRTEPSSQLPLPLKNIFQRPLDGQIARPSSAPLPPGRSHSARPSVSSRSNTANKSQDPTSSDIKGKGRENDARQSAKDKSMPPPSSMSHLGSAATPQPDLLHRLRHCCHLSDVHVTSDPGLLLFASRLCLAVGCEHDGRHGDSDYNDLGHDPTLHEPAHDGDYLKLEAAWQLLRQHLDPPSPEDAFETLPDLSGSGSKAGGKPVDGQNQIATGRLAAEMVLRAVRAKTQGNEGEERQQGGNDMSRWIACRKTLGMSVDNAMIMALVNGFGGNWNNMHG